MTTAKLVPFEAWHAVELAMHDEEAGKAVALTHGMAAVVESTGTCYTLLVGPSVVACGGVVPQWPGRSQAWMFFTPGAGRYMRRITKAVAAGVEATPGRIELTVLKDYKLGHRWAKMLGFEVETPCLRQYDPDGQDHVGYVRINEGVE